MIHYQLIHSFITMAQTHNAGTSQNIPGAAKGLQTTPSHALGTMWCQESSQLVHARHVP